MDLSDHIPGYKELVEWCDGWPSFHDAEIARLELKRRAASRLVLQVLGGPKPTFGPRADSRFSSPPVPLVVTFTLDEIEDLCFEGFSHQNVVFGVDLSHDAGLFQLTLYPCYGLSGWIRARKISIELQPGESAD